MPNAKSARSKASLTAARAQIDAIDSELFRLLAERAQVARRVGLAKASDAKAAGKTQSSILVPEREEQINRRIGQLARQSGLPPSLMEAIFADVISLCRAMQGQLTAHVLGPAGTHSEWAARARFGEALSIVHHRSIQEVIKATEKSVASGNLNAVALVPIENSLEGTVNATLDALIGTNLKLVGEGYFRVRHALYTRARSYSKIRVVRSHPQALAQCARWLKEHLPHAKLLESTSTAEAAKTISSTAAAIASPNLASSLKLSASVQDIQDSAENTTRFGILGAREPMPSADEVGDKTSLVFSLPNKSGSLAEAISIFSKSGLNMTKIESRPQRGAQWEYLFFVDIDGHANEPKVKRALDQFDQKTQHFKVLGTYPKGHVWN